jgi:very-short-patch-repair endonuclease
VGDEGVDWEMARLAERQHGVVSRAQLRGLGLRDGGIEHALAIGRLHPVFHAVFSVGHPGVGEKGRMRAAVLVQTAAMLRLLDLPEIDAILDGPRRRGSRYLREILIDWRALPPDARMRSLLEARLFSRLAARDLPIPLCNRKLWAGGRRIEVDFLWPKHRVVVETDGAASHGTIAAFHEDRRRDRDLTLAGYDALRITWDQLDNEPEATLAAIAKLLRAATSAQSAAAAA